MALRRQARSWSCSSRGFSSARTRWPRRAVYLAGLVTRFGGGSAFVHAAVLRDSFILCAGLLAIEWIARQRSSPLELRDWPRAIRWPIYYAVMALILWKGNSNYVPCIYFNF